jgi:NADP-dependent 3-hydroxy acid dehydrogenase YdfG
MKIKIFAATLFCLAFSVASPGSHAHESASAYDEFVKKAQSEIVIVTGSNRGLGLAWVKHYLAAGKSVIATCRKPAAAIELLELSEQYGAQLLIEQLDVTDEASISRLGSHLKQHQVSIDVGISNAGVTVTEQFGNWTRKGFEANISVNTIGAALFAQLIAPHLNDGAMLVQITSAVGSISRARRDNPLDAYAVSKAGLNMLTRRLAVKLKDRDGNARTGADRYESERDHFGRGVCCVDDWLAAKTDDGGQRHFYQQRRQGDGLVVADMPLSSRF